MKTKISFLIILAFIFGCTSDNDDSGSFAKAPTKTAAELNKVKEVQLETLASNQSDESNRHRAVLYLTDYDKAKDQPVAVMDGHFEKGSTTNFSPYVSEWCFSIDACGIAITDVASLESITLEQAMGVMNKDGLKDSDTVDKNLFKNGTLILIHSETRETDKSPVWLITVAVEMKDFKQNAKYVKIKYKVLQYKLK